MPTTATMANIDPPEESWLLERVLTQREILSAWKTSNLCRQS